jgi:hypothetical protein
LKDVLDVLVAQIKQVSRILGDGVQLGKEHRRNGLIVFTEAIFLDLLDQSVFDRGVDNKYYLFMHRCPFW